MARKTPVSNETRQDLSGRAWEGKLYAISDYLARVKFARRFSGVDEADVWRKTEKLCQLYEDALTTERLRAQALEQELAQLRQKHQALLTKSQSLLEAYRRLSGEGRADG